MVARVKTEYSNMPMIITALREVRSRMYPVGCPDGQAQGENRRQYRGYD